MSKKIIDTHYQHVEANVLFCFIFRRRITFPLVEDDIVWNQSLYDIKIKSCLTIWVNKWESLEEKGNACCMWMIEWNGDFYFENEWYDMEHAYKGMRNG